MPKKPAPARKKAAPKAKPRKQAKTKTTDKLLPAILAQVAFDGWTMTALRNGARSAGVEEGRLQLTYPRGVRDAVDAFSAWANEQMLEHIADDRLFASRRVRDKVAKAVRARFEALLPHREAMRHLVIWASVPYHAPYAVKNLYAACDAIWRVAGDTSTDFNFYTKRGLLAYVLKTTTLFWLADQSEDQSETWQFLDRRIAEVLKLGQAAGQLKSLPEHFEKLGALADIARFFKRAA